MDIFKKKMCNWIKTWWADITPNDKITFLLAFSTFVVTIIGVAIAYFGLLPQLQELNAEGKIIGALTVNGNVIDATSSISLNLVPVLMNIGYGTNCFDTDQWQVDIFFKDGVSITDYDHNTWQRVASSMYEHDGMKRILCKLSDPYGQYGFLDDFGFFNVTIATSTNKEGQYLPLALFVSHGYKTPTIYIQAFFDQTAGTVKYKEIQPQKKQNPYDFSDSSNLVGLPN